MHKLIEKAKSHIENWTSDEPRDLTLAVAAMCRDVLDDGPLPSGDAAWGDLRRSFNIELAADCRDDCKVG